MVKNRPIEVLSVEDNPADVTIIRALFKSSRVPSRVSFVVQGEDVMRYLRREPPYETAVRPDLILLDLNLPGKDGREVLQELKRDPDFRLIPVIVLSASDRKEDILRSYELLANSFVTKPADFDGFDAAIRSIENYWFSVVRLPSPAF